MKNKKLIRITTVSTSLKILLKEQHRFLTSNPDIVSEYALKGFQTGKKNHDNERLNNVLLISLQTLFNKQKHHGKFKFNI